MANNPIPFTVVEPSRGEPNQNCIAALETALARARAGVTVGVVLVEQGLDSTAGWNWGGTCGSYSMLGAIQVMQAALVADQVADDF